MKTEVKDAGDLRRYRTEIPNIIDDADLSVYAFRLYVHLKRVAGDSGMCWKGERTLADDCKISRGKVRDAKEELVKAGFIVITPGAEGESDRIVITNIWTENMETYFHEGGTPRVPGGIQREQVVVHGVDQGGTPCVPKEVTQEERTQEEATTGVVATRATDAVSLCRQVTKRSPNPQQRKQITAEVTDLERWQRVLEQYAAEGQPPNRVDWMLERYHGRGSPRAAPQVEKWQPSVPTVEQMAIAEGITIEEARARYAGIGITTGT